MKPTKKKGFGLRLRRAKEAIKKYGRVGVEPYSRSFDNCFEEGDGSLIVAAIMEAATRESKDIYETQSQDFLKRGIRLLGVWDEWMNTYESVRKWSPDYAEGRPT